MVQAAKCGGRGQLQHCVIDDLTEHGTIEARRFYESPFTDVSPRGPEGLFSTGEVDRLVAAAKTVRDQAAVA